MKRSVSRKQTRVAKQALQIAALAPVVASARVAHVASGDYSALVKMGTEKVGTFNSAATAMMFASAAAFTRSALVLAHAWSPWGGTPFQRLARASSAWSSACADIVNSALTPMHKRVS